MIRKIEPPPSDAKATLRERADSTDDIVGVIVLELHRDGSQRIFTNSMNAHEKCFLKCFLDSYVSRWFAEAETVEPIA